MSSSTSLTANFDISDMPTSTREYLQISVISPLPARPTVAAPAKQRSPPARFAIYFFCLCLFSLSFLLFLYRNDLKIAGNGSDHQNCKSDKAEQEP